MKNKTLFYNGTIYTADRSRPYAESIVIKGNIIEFVGDLKQALLLADDDTDQVDLEGKMLLPGFVDSHAHPASASTEELFMVDLHGASAWTEYVDKVADFRRTNPKCRIIQGIGWLNHMFTQEKPDKYMLDKICPDIPVILLSEDHHSMWVNSEAIKAADSIKPIDDFQSGHVERDEKGNPTGLFNECKGIFAPVIADYTIEEYEHALQYYQDKMAQYGITMAHDAGIEYDSNAYKAMKKMDASGKWKIKMTASYVTFNGDDSFLDKIEKYEESRNSMLDFEHIKYMIDGVIEGRTGYLKKPYADDAEYNGVLRWNIDKLKKSVAKADKLGYDLHMHVIGDQAFCIMMDMIDYINDINGSRMRRPMAAHAQIVDEADMDRAAEHGVVISSNPYWFVKEEYYDMLEVKYLGEERACNEYPLKSFFERDMCVAAGSDFNVTKVPAPLDGILKGHIRCESGKDYNDINNVLNPKERASVKQMIDAFTINGAYALHKEKETGSLTAGKKADIVILDRNILDSSPELIAEAKVIKTISEGKVVYI